VVKRELPQDLVDKYREYAKNPNAAVPPKGSSAPSSSFSPQEKAPVAVIEKTEEMPAPELVRMPPPQDLVEKYRSFKL